MTAMAPPHCDCPDCRAARWDDPAPPTYTSHEVVDAYQAGRLAGMETTVRDLIDTLTLWLKTDPYEPVQDETDDS